MAKTDEVNPNTIGFIESISLFFRKGLSSTVNVVEMGSNITEMGNIASDMGVTSFKSKHTIHHYTIAADEYDQLKALRESHPHLFQ